MSETTTDMTDRGHMADMADTAGCADSRDTMTTPEARMGGARRMRILDACMDFALVFAIIYNSNSLWALAGDNFSLSCIVLCLVGMAYVLWCWWLHRARARRTGYAMCALMAATVVGQLIMTIAHGGSGFTDGTWFQYALIVPILLGCMLMRGRDYLRTVLFVRLVWVAAAFAAISVLLWFATSFLMLPPSHWETLAWVHDAPPIASYLDVYYNVQDAHVLGMTVWRNSSIFNEPPCASAFYGIVLAIDLYVVKKPHWIADVCLIAALATSLSTGGVLYILLLLVPLLWKAMWHVRRKALRYTLLTGAAVVSLVAVVVVVRLVVSKLATSYSGQTHLLDFTEGVRIWWQHPLVGFGFNSDAYIWTHYMSAYRDGMGYTSGLLFLLIHGGLVLGIYMLAPFVLMVAGERDWHAWYAVGFTMLVFITTPIQNCAFLLLMAAYGYASFIWRYRARLAALPIIRKEASAHA